MCAIAPYTMICGSGWPLSVAGIVSSIVSTWSLL